MSMKLIYVSGPYRASTEEGRIRNVAMAATVAKDLWLKGWSVICPHANTHLNERDGITADQFIAGDCEQVRRCDAIYMMENWKDSEGARKEQAAAIAARRAVFFHPHIPDPSECVDLTRLSRPTAAQVQEAELCALSVPQDAPHHSIRTFATGSVRDSAAGKPRPDLASPFAQLRLGEVLRLGAAPKSEGGKAYGERNWEKGQPQSQFYASAERHRLAWLCGDKSEDHLAQWFWNVHCMLHQEEAVKRNILPASLLDLPDYSPKP